MDGHLGGEGIVQVGPLGHQGPQGCVGGKDAVVAVAVDPGWGEDVRQTIQNRSEAEMAVGKFFPNSRREEGANRDS